MLPEVQVKVTEFDVTSEAARFVGGRGTADNTVHYLLKRFILVLFAITALELH